MARRVTLILLLLAGWSQAVSAQQAGSAAKLSRTQIEGRLLYNQHCGVCHTKPTILSPYYGPALSKDVVGAGNDDAIRQFIGEGTERMPGFSHSLTPPQIDAIVQFLKTVPAPAAEAPRPARPASPASQREQD